MKIDKNELSSLLAQTKLKVKDEGEMIERLNKDLNFVEKLFDVDTTNVKPLYHVVDLDSRTREDEVGPTLENNTIMKLARQGEYGYIVVPAVPAALESSEHHAKTK